MEEIKIDLPVCNQFDESHDKDWAHRMCAACSLWMLLKHHDRNFPVSPAELKDRLTAAGGYQEGVGFRHAAIVALAGTYGLELQYAAKFFLTNEEKELGLAVIEKNIRNGQPVMVSVVNELNPVRSSHLVVIHGLRRNGGEVEGYLVQDPDGRWRGHNYFLTKREFLSCWRGGLISGKPGQSFLSAKAVVLFLRKILGA